MKKKTLILLGMMVFFQFSFTVRVFYTKICKCRKTKGYLL